MLFRVCAEPCSLDFVEEVIPFGVAERGSEGEGAIRLEPGLERPHLG